MPCQPLVPPPPGAAARAISDSDYRALTQSVTKLQRAEWFGSYDLLWGQGTAIALDTDGRPIVTATKYGAGRIVHFASGGCLGGWAGVGGGRRGDSREIPSAPLLPWGRARRAGWASAAHGESVQVAPGERQRY